MTSTKQASCKDRIALEMAIREEYISNLLEIAEGGDNGVREQDDAWQELHQLPLSIDSKTVTTVLLSYGGPSDEIEIIHDGAEIESVTYIFKDWFDGARESVSEDSTLWCYAEAILEGLSA